MQQMGGTTLGEADIIPEEEDGDLSDDETAKVDTHAVVYFPPTGTGSYVIADADIHDFPKQ